MVSIYVLIYGQRKLWLTTITITMSGRGERQRKGAGAREFSIDSSIVK